MRWLRCITHLSDADNESVSGAPFTGVRDKLGESKLDTTVRPRSGHGAACPRAQAQSARALSAQLNTCWLKLSSLFNPASIPASRP